MEAKAYYWSLSGQGITVPQIIASSGLDAKRVKMAEKTQKNGKESCKKYWLNKENIIFLWLGRVSKTRRILSENGRLEIFTENERFPAKTGGLESLFSLNNIYSSSKEQVMKMN